MRTTGDGESRPAVEVLFGTYRRRILSLLLLHPDDSLHVREIARVTSTPAGSLHRELMLLSQAGLLVRERSGNQVRYRADRQCPIFEDLAAIFRKTTGLADVLREALEPLAENIDVAFIFGSVAQGRERQVSDVDVVVVGAVSFPSVVEALNRTHEQLRRPVNPVVMTTAVFRRKHRGGDRFVTRIVREPKIFLIGGARELGELAEDRSAQGAPARRGGNPAAASSGAEEPV
jgi:predicted nucleotidyltransferase